MEDYSNQPPNELAAFVDMEPAKERVLVADRSTLEAFADCPAQGYQLVSGKLNTHSAAANSGEEVHQAVSKTIVEYIDRNGNMMPNEVISELESNILSARPDVQPDAIRGLFPSLYVIGRLIASTAADNILAFDGGEQVGRSGQLAYDLQFGDTIVRATSEIDLLIQHKGIEVPTEYDWKSGQKQWSAWDVRDSFQMQMHALLILMKYPELPAVRCQIVTTRQKRSTDTVTFSRDNLDRIRTRIRQAAGEFFQHHNNPEAPTWPGIEKCTLCDAAATCPLAGEVVRDLHADPGEFIEQMLAVDSKLADMKKLANSYIDKNGTITSARGICYGRDKPSSRKPTAYFYPSPE